MAAIEALGHFLPYTIQVLIKASMPGEYLYHTVGQIAFRFAYTCGQDRLDCFDSLPSPTYSEQRVLPLFECKLSRLAAYLRPGSRFKWFSRSP